MKKKHYEIVIDTEQSHFLSAVLVSKFRQSLKVGFATNGREIVYDIGIEYYQDQYEIDSFTRLFKGIIKGWPVQSVWNPPYFFPTSDEKIKVSTLLHSIEKPLVCIFSGASIEQRHWPVKRWGAVAEYLWEDGFQPVLLGGKNELELTREITKQTDSPVINLCSKLTLSETSALFEKSKLLISTDSGILHLGVLLNMPTVSLFGPGIAKKWGVKDKKHILLNKEISCSPCTRFGETPPCPIDVQCMKAITVNDVINATSKLLKK